MNVKLVIAFVLLAPVCAFSQEDMLEMLEKEGGSAPEYVAATFKGTRLINGHSVETRKKGTLDFIIGHRFGLISSGADDLFGLDDSQIRLGLDYAVSDQFTIGIGRSSLEKTIDGFLKYKLLRQQTGKKNIPVTVTGFSSMAIKTQEPADSELDFTTKLTYAYQLIIARKFSQSFSFQLLPTMVHRNAVLPGAEGNDLFAVGAGGRIKLTKRISFNAEYYYQLNRIENSLIKNSVAIGFDIETGGHVFQLHFTNSRAMIEKGFITETTTDFFDGDIHFGFNISRSFQLHRQK